jgi:hypothetical protein
MAASTNASRSGGDTVLVGELELEREGGPMSVMLASFVVAYALVARPVPTAVQADFGRNLRHLAVVAVLPSKHSRTAFVRFTKAP